MADRYVATGYISAGYDEEKDEDIAFEPGDYVEGLKGEQMKQLWDMQVIVPADSDRAKQVRIEAGKEDPGERVPKFGEFFQTESAPVDPVSGRQAGTSHPDFPFSSVESKEITPAQSAEASKNAEGMDRSVGGPAVKNQIPPSQQPKGTTGKAPADKK